MSILSVFWHYISFILSNRDPLQAAGRIAQDRTRTALGDQIPTPGRKTAGPAADREEYREPFLLFHDRLWTKINLRNDRQSFQQDFFRYDIPSFDETSIREALLNAICHRDYRLGGSLGAHTRQQGLDYETNKEFLFKHTSGPVVILGRKWLSWNRFFPPNPA